MNAVLRVFMVLMFAVASSVEAGSIVGSLKLPTPYTQMGDMQISVSARSTTTNHLRPSPLITIAEAQATSGGLFAFSISGLNDAEDYQLSYSCQTFTFPEPCENIVTRAYYKATNQSVFRSAEASIFSGSSDHSVMELPILTGNIISGTIHYPALQAAPVDGIKLSVSLVTVNNPVTSLTVTSFIAEGQSMDAYQVMIPNDVLETWKLEYNCFSFLNPNGACDDFLPSGYFNSSATNNTVEMPADAEILPGNQNAADIDMTLLTGYTITGNLSIPTPPTEAGGILLTVSARDSNNPANNATKQITIAQGASSAPFEITIPTDASAEWRIRYNCEAEVTPIECNKYLDVGYFDSSVVGTMTTPNSFDGDQLAGGESHSGIDFSIISGFAITGKLILSNGVAPEGGVSFTVSANNTSGSGGSVVSLIEIAENQNQVDYQLNVDTSASKLWRISFNCQEVFTPVCLEIADEGYYDATTGNTVEDSSNAASLTGGVNHSNINLIVESSALPTDDLCVPIKTTNGAVVVVCL